ncbi:hypothetical protein YB2330_002019 [Saitoella coloradoensis]
MSAPPGTRTAAQERYTRRILKIRPPNLRMRRLKVGTYAVTAALGVFCVMFADYNVDSFGRDGKRLDHCFSSIQRWAQQKKEEFFTLSEEDKLNLKLAREKLEKSKP